ncbi:MAG: glycosyltransferase family 4 protein [Bacteroidota bacterium]|jgi:glycosyltransferase involved in cell wall biosynthesis|nr:glycosyltransferase family 4 protein [Bacteroidota bacterium]
MHILALISYKVFPAEMGGQKGIADFYHYLSTYDQITILASKNNALNDIPFVSKFNYMFPHGKGLLNLLKLPFVVQLIYKKKIDLIIVEHSYWGWYGYILRLITGVPFIIHSHNIEAFRFKMQGNKFWRFYGIYEKKIHQLCNYQFFKCADDADYAFHFWHIPYSKMVIIPYGTHFATTPETDYKINARNTLIHQFKISPNTFLLLFNGTLNYTPNKEALEKILQNIVPALKQANFLFCLLICGKNLPQKFKHQIEKQYPEIQYIGFVDNFNLIMAGVDALILPGMLATGIKTKIIEALALNTVVITTKTGARGIPDDTNLTNLICVNDKDGNAFNKEIISLQPSKCCTPQSFYNTFYWGNIAKMAHEMLLKING